MEEIKEAKAENAGFVADGYNFRRLGGGLENGNP